MASINSEFQDVVPPGKPFAGPQAGAAGEELIPLRHIQKQMLLEVSAGRLEGFSEKEARLELTRLTDELARQQSYPLDIEEQAALIEKGLHEFFGFGPIHDLMREQGISEILINGPRQVYVERAGQLQTATIHFRDEAHLLQVLERMVASTGRRLDKQSPVLDTRVADGSRMNVVLRPPALNGPLVSIRRFGARPLTADDLLANETMTKEMFAFLSACVKCRFPS